MAMWQRGHTGITKPGVTAYIDNIGPACALQAAMEGYWATLDLVIYRLTIVL
jgi:hypothetical protein